MVVESFVKSRRGILQHLKEHRLNTSQFAVFQLLVLLADKATGVVWIDAPLIISQYFHDMPLKTAQASLAALKRKGYIKSFQQQGSRSTYPVLVNKYEITVGELKGGLTNAEQTVDWRRPVISGRTETGSETGSEVGSEHRTPYSRPQNHKTSQTSRPRKNSHKHDGDSPAVSRSKSNSKSKTSDELAPGQVEWSRQELGVGPPEEFEERCSGKERCPGEVSVIAYDKPYCRACANEKFGAEEIAASLDEPESFKVEDVAIGDTDGLD